VLSCIALSLGVALFTLVIQVVSLGLGVGIAWRYAVEETAELAPEIVGLTTVFLALPTIVAIIWALRQDGAAVTQSVEQVFGDGHV
jgi:DNA-binding transcriptional LysR family regulator